MWFVKIVFINITHYMEVRSNDVTQFINNVSTSGILTGRVIYSVSDYLNSITGFITYYRFGHNYERLYSILSDSVLEMT